MFRFRWLQKTSCSLHSQKWFLQWFHLFSRRCRWVLADLHQWFTEGHIWLACIFEAVWWQLVASSQESVRIYPSPLLCQTHNPSKFWTFSCAIRCRDRYQIPLPMCHLENQHLWSCNFRSKDRTLSQYGSMTVLHSRYAWSHCCLQPLLWALHPESC